MLSLSGLMHRVLRRHAAHPKGELMKPADAIGFTVPARPFRRRRSHAATWGMDAEIQEDWSAHAEA